MGAQRIPDHPPWPGHLPGVGLGRPFVDADHVADPAPTVPAPLAARPSNRTVTPQTVKHAGVEHIPRRHGHITVDRLLRDPPRRVPAKLTAPQRGLAGQGRGGEGVARTSRVRADTTVVPANVCYPTDSGLLAKAIRRIRITGQRIQSAGGATRTRIRDRSRAAGKRAHGIAAKLRSRSQLGRDQVNHGVARITGELADLAEAAARDAHRLLGNARRALRRAQAKAAQLAEAGVRDAAAGRRRGRLARAVGDLSNLLEATTRIIGQTRQRIAGTTPDGATRVVSLHDRDARPIAKGRLGKPVEFGYKGQIVDNDDGIILDHDVQAGNPADAPQLAPAIHRVKARAGRAPGTVTADRGYGEAAVEQDLADLAVRTVIIPRKGKPGLARQQLERRRTFRRTIKWRTRCEGRISTLKRGYGWDRTRLDSLEGAKTWTGQGVFTHNLTKIAALIA